MAVKAPGRPKQARSQATLDRLLAAVETLLRQKSFSDISVAEIVDTAASSTGAFYKRFSSKADVLPYLLEKLQTEQLAKIESFVADEKWQGVNLADRVRIFFKILSQSYLQNRGLVRALVSRQFSDRSELPPDEIRKARALVDLIAEWLLECEPEIRHPSPAEAIRVGMFFSITGLQVGLLFRPPSKRFNDALLVKEIANALLAYLGVERSDR